MSHKYSRIMDGMETTEPIDKAPRRVLCRVVELPRLETQPEIVCIAIDDDTLEIFHAEVDESLLVLKLAEMSSPFIGESDIGLFGFMSGTDRFTFVTKNPRKLYSKLSTQVSVPSAPTTAPVVTRQPFKATTRAGPTKGMRQSMQENCVNVQTSNRM